VRAGETRTGRLRLIPRRRPANFLDRCGSAEYRSADERWCWPDHSLTESAATPLSTSRGTVFGVWWQFAVGFSLNPAEVLDGTQ